MQLLKSWCTSRDAEKKTRCRLLGLNPGFSYNLRCLIPARESFVIELEVEVHAFKLHLSLDVLWRVWSE